jgi:aryl-alcohol dehydrogenase-like predicted oxidoreductase
MQIGKTDVDVSTLSLGGVLKATYQLIFRQTFKSGVTYLDTAGSHGWGSHEKAISNMRGFDLVGSVLYPWRWRPLALEIQAR